MKKKTTIVAVSALLVSATLAITSIYHGRMALALKKTLNDAYSINAFQAVKNNPSANVTLSTINNNEINMTTSGLSVNGDNLVLAAGGYLEVARDELHPFNNGIAGLTSLTTDMVGRIEYSYPDQLYVVDDAIDGNYTFPESVKPSYFKLYNDSENPVELSSLTINYSCTETTSSDRKSVV